MEILASGKPKAYQSPPRFPSDMTLAERIALEPEGYQPIRHANTAVDADEALYESFLLPIDEAVQKLKRYHQRRRNSSGLGSYLSEAGDGGQKR